MWKVDQTSHEVELLNPHLWWVLSGTLWVRVRPAVARDAIGDHRLGSDEALYVDRGTRVSVTRGPGTTALGFPVDTGDTGSSLPFACAGVMVRGEVPDTWRDTLINSFANSLSYLRTSENLDDGESAVGEIPPRPRFPVSPAAGAVARILLEDPASTLSVPELADAVFTSPSTLNRLFRAETSLSVGAWRARLRLHLAAVGLRVPGVTIDSLAHRSGLSSASSLCRLFQKHTGKTPTHYRHKDAVTTAPGGSTPARSTWPRTNRLHVLIWAWRGGCQVTAGSESICVPEGDLVWLPAGVPNQVTMDSGGLVLPVGARAGSVAGRLWPLSGSSPEDLLGALGREYDPVAPEHTELVDSMFYAYLSSGGAEDGVKEGGGATGAPAGVGASDSGSGLSGSGAQDRAFRTLHESRLLRQLTEQFRRNPAVSFSLSQWSGHLGCDTDELSAALELFGVRDIRQWASQVRMVTARRLLASGIPVGTVARHLGYSSTASFSHVFRRTHGVAPRDYTGYV